MKSQLCIYIILICISLQLHTTTALDKQYLQLMSITSVDVTDPYPATNEREFFCLNAFQIDFLNESNFLVGLCKPYYFTLAPSSSVIGTLPTDILVADPPYDYNLPMNEQYGNASMPTPSAAVDQYSWDGISTEAQINFPEHLIQSPDGNIVYFIDFRSCLRKLNRTTGQVTTVIGICLNGTLGIPGTYIAGAYGVVYFEKEGRRIFVFTVIDFGIYVCYEETPGQEDYQCRQVIEHGFISEIEPVNARTLTRGVNEDGTYNNYVWQKIRLGLNRYDFTEIFDNLNDTYVKLTYDNDTFVHYISVHSVEAVEPNAWYKNRTQDLGLAAATISFSSDGKTMVIIDCSDDGLYFIDTDASDGIDHVIEYCELDLTIVRGEDNIDNCTFTDALGGFWLEDKGQVIVTERDPGIIRIAQFPIPPRTTTTTTATSTTITPPLLPPATAPASTPNIPAIALGVSTGLLAIALLILSLIHWNYRRNVGNNGGMVSSNRREQHEHASNPMELNALQSGGGVGATSGNRGDNYTSLDTSRREEHAYAAVEDGDMEDYEIMDPGQPARVNTGRNEQ